ncbi:MAG: hypothetical protein JW889_13305 [Verrucomicrobia bacterium]|nr:hypothetical protein [Verrucomicrobiota bacterium]
MAPAKWTSVVLTVAIAGVVLITPARVEAQGRQSRRGAQQSTPATPGTPEGPGILREGFDDGNAIGRSFTIQGSVRHDARTRRMLFGGTGWFATRREFSNQLEVIGHVFIPSTLNTRLDEVGLLLRERQGRGRYTVTLIYGRQHPAYGSLVIARDGTIGALAPLTVRRGQWYRILVRVDGLRLSAKAWPVGEREPHAFQVACPLQTGWQASGGIGFTHVGFGTLVDDLGVNDYGPITAAEAMRAALPRPILDDRPDYAALYWRAWEIAFDNVRRGTAGNGFAPAYLDVGGASLHQWDTCFTTMFTLYSNGLLPGVESLDSFYRKQHVDGFICRELRRRNGADAHPPHSDEAINPPLFAWAEWRAYRFTGDVARLRAVLPVLARYYYWIALNRSSPNGLLFQSNRGSGMDNAPRSGATWIDLSAQQAHAAMLLSFIAAEVGDEPARDFYAREHLRLLNGIEQLCWDERTNFYYDLDANGAYVPVKTAASFWTLLALVPTYERADGLVRHLMNRDEFLTQHRVPTLSADHADFKDKGDYFLGGVWAPIDFMIVKGLEAYGREDDARLIALNHLTMMARAMKDTGTIWQYYAPDGSGPGAEAQQGFVGWSGLGPIALLIEEVIGIRVDGANHSIFWRIREAGRHGIENLNFGDTTASLVCSRPDAAGRRMVTIATTSQLVITLDTPAGRLVRTIFPGTTTMQVQINAQ